MLDDIVKKNGFDPDLVEDIGYRNEEITIVKMGRSSRYGYRNTGKELWEVPQRGQSSLACPRI